MERLKRGRVKRSIDLVDDFLENDHEISKLDLENIFRDYKKNNDRLYKIIKLSDRQEKTLIQLNEELDQYKKNLEIKVEEEIAKRKEKEKLLFQQSKLAAMGEMMDAVAHQWKQPLSIINLRAMTLELDFEDGEINKEYIKEVQESILAQTTHMTNTLDTFRGFFRPNKSISFFDAKKMVQSSLRLIEKELRSNSIEVTIEEKNKFELQGIENEFIHLVLNIINNAKDAFIENKVKNRNIVITIDGTDNSLKITDNAKGIPEDIIENIFKANFTTKEEGKGTGIGLYMSLQIAQKHHGDLTVQNIEDGAQFTFRLSPVSAL